MSTADKRLLARALAREEEALAELVDLVGPVIQVRVARILAWTVPSGREIRSELEDMVQEVFARLFDDDGRVLRTWDPERGMSLKNYVGLLAERQIVSLLRIDKRSPWTEEPAPANVLDVETVEPIPRLESKDMLERLLLRLRDTLSPQGLELFRRLWIEEQSVEVVVEATGLSPDAVYAWRSRIRKVTVRLASELEAEQSETKGSPRRPGKDAP